MSDDFVKHYERKLMLMAELRNAIPDTSEAYAALYDSTLGSEGNMLHRDVLSSKYKELIALAIAVALRAEDEIGVHTFDALRCGATHEEILQVMGVAILMGGSPAVGMACKVLDFIEQFQAQASSPQTSAAVDEVTFQALRTA